MKQKFKILNFNLAKWSYILAQAHNVRLNIVHLKLQEWFDFFCYSFFLVLKIDLPLDWLLFFSTHSYDVYSNVVSRILMMYFIRFVLEHIPPKWKCRYFVEMVYKIYLCLLVLFFKLLVEMLKPFMNMYFINIVLCDGGDLQF